MSLAASPQRFDFFGSANRERFVESPDLNDLVLEGWSSPSLEARSSGLFPATPPMVMRPYATSRSESAGRGACSASSTSRGSPLSHRGASNRGSPRARGGPQRPLQGAGAQQVQQQRERRQQQYQAQIQNLQQQHQQQLDYQARLEQRRHAELQQSPRHESLKSPRHDNAQAFEPSSPRRHSRRMPQSLPHKRSSLATSDVDKESSVKLPHATQARTFHAADSTAWDVFMSNGQEAASRLRKAVLQDRSIAKRLAGRLDMASMEKMCLTGVVLMYCTSANPMQLYEVDALRQAKITLESIPQVAVVGAVVIPHADATLKEQGVEHTRHISFTDRVDIARMVIKNAGEERWVFVDSCMEGCLKDFNGDISPCISIYAKGRLRSAVLDPRVMRVLLEDPVHTNGFFNYTHIRVGAPRTGFGFGGGGNEGTGGLGGTPQAAGAFPSLTGLGEPWPTRRRSRMSSKGDPTLAEAAEVASAAAVAARAGAPAAPAPAPAQRRTTHSGVEVVCAGGVRRCGGAEGPGGAPALTSLGGVEAVVVDVPKITQMEDLTWISVKSPSDPACFQVLERMCGGSDVAERIRKLSDRRRNFVLWSPSDR